ncbi:MAG: immunity protein YezG family protein [Candidatus Pristimantibacillus sp.]|uniref:immunity protein YezG family protein n=1 Tax=Paenibacillus sp. FSL H7-0331 TaxID=1920421 RepID=UPI00096C7F88|nr:immunity protein YezG family protein [Paenibacillus sp. FSL H7-0331]OME95705.1 hypothetical protein BK127_41325 [Paenibacillus sp. FSL H7-0331]
MKTVDKIYESIVTNISTVINGEWVKAKLDIEVIGEMVSFTGNYLNNKNETIQIDVDEFDFQLTFDVLELHKITTEGGNNKWNRAVFSVQPDGAFDMEFIWDQELQDEIERLA